MPSRVNSGFITAAPVSKTAMRAAFNTTRDEFNQSSDVVGYSIKDKDFGAVGNGIVDDSDAIIAGVNYLRANGGGTLLFPPGVYRVTKEIPMHPTASLVLLGTRGSIIEVDFDGPARSAFNATSPLLGATADPILAFNPINGDITQNYRAPNRLFIEGLHFRAAWRYRYLLDHAGAMNTPVIAKAFMYRMCSGLYMSDCYFDYVGASNSAICVTGGFNTTFSDVIVWGGGAARPFDLRMARVSMTTDNRTITCDRPHWTSEHVGHCFVVSTGPFAQQLIAIESVLNPTTCVSTVATTPTFDIPSTQPQPIAYGPVRISMAAGSNIVTAEAQLFRVDNAGNTVRVPAFRASDRDRRIAIANATTSAMGMGNPTPIPRVARITNVLSGTQATVNRTAERNTGLQPIAFEAQFDMWEETGQSSEIRDGPNDVLLRRVSLEQSCGIGLGYSAANLVRVESIKFEPVNPWSPGQSNVALPEAQTCNFLSYVWNDSGSLWSNIVASYAGINNLGAHMLWFSTNGVVREQTSGTKAFGYRLYNFGDDVTAAKSYVGELKLWSANTRADLINAVHPLAQRGQSDTSNNPDGVVRQAASLRTREIVTELADGTDAQAPGFVARDTSNNIAGRLLLTRLGSTLATAWRVLIRASSTGAENLIAQFDETSVTIFRRLQFGNITQSLSVDPTANTLIGINPVNNAGLTVIHPGVTTVVSVVAGLPTLNIVAPAFANNAIAAANNVPINGIYWNTTTNQLARRI